VRPASRFDLRQHPAAPGSYSESMSKPILVREP